MCVKKTKHPNNSKSRVCNNETPTCSKVSLNSVKVKPIPSKYHMYENLKTALGSITTSFNFKPYISVPFFKTLMLISYAYRSANARPGIFHSLSLTKFSYPLKAPLSRTWNAFLLGLDWKGIPGIGHSYPFSAVTGGTFWLQVNERFPKDLPPFVLLWCLLPECQIWSLFTQYTALFLLSAVIENELPLPYPDHSYTLSLGLLLHGNIKVEGKTSTLWGMRS